MLNAQDAASHASPSRGFAFSKRQTEVCKNSEKLWKEFNLQMQTIQAESIRRDFSYPYPLPFL